MAESLLAAQPTGNTSLTRLQESSGPAREERKTNLLSALQQKTQVTGTDTSEAIIQRQLAALNKQPGFEGTTQAATVGGLVDTFRTTKKSAQETGAFNKALGTEKIESTFEAFDRLNAIGEDVAQQAASARGLFEQAVTSAKENVKLIMQGVVDSLAEFDNIASKIGKTLRFALAHDMQVAVQAVLGSMNRAETEVINTHQLGSAEHQQFLATKLNALALTQSSLQAQYANKQADIDVQLSGQRVALGSDVRQSADFARLNLTNREAALADGAAQLLVQKSQIDIGLEQVRMNFGSDMQEFLAAIPGQSIDLAPLILQMNAVAASIPEPEPYTGFSGFRTV